MQPRINSDQLRISALIKETRISDVSASSIRYARVVSKSLHKPIKIEKGPAGI